MRILSRGMNFFSGHNDDGLVLVTVCEMAIGRPQRRANSCVALPKSEASIRALRTDEILQTTIRAVEWPVASVTSCVCLCLRERPRSKRKTA